MRISHDEDRTGNILPVVVVVAQHNFALTQMQVTMVKARHSDSQTIRNLPSSLTT